LQNLEVLQPAHVARLQQNEAICIKKSQILCSAIPVSPFEGRKDTGFKRLCDT
jgi:hypothetical protein